MELIFVANAFVHAGAIMYTMIFYNIPAKELDEPRRPVSNGSRIPIDIPLGSTKLRQLKNIRY